MTLINKHKKQQLTSSHQCTTHYYWLAKWASIVLLAGVSHLQRCRHAGWPAAWERCSRWCRARGRLVLRRTGAWAVDTARRASHAMSH